MFDFHMHSTVSFDGRNTALEMARAAKEAGLQEICFTEHIDRTADPDDLTMVFDPAHYSAVHDTLQMPGLTIRKGMEFGMTPSNAAQFARDEKRRDFDFVLGSVHFVDSLDIYVDRRYWQGRTVREAYQRYLEETLACVQAHNGFDVLAHLSYICKARVNPTHEILYYRDYPEIGDEILRVLVRKGKGLEINTSGVDRCGSFLPEPGFVHRFHELGGEIVTVGSDAHDNSRVGQYADRALTLLKEEFGYVCTFCGRKPVFHDLK